MLFKYIILAFEAILVGLKDLETFAIVKRLLSIRGVIKKFSARYASMEFIELKSLSVGDLI